MKKNYQSLLVTLLFLSLSCSTKTSQSQEIKEEIETEYLKQKLKFKTTLIFKEKAPQDYEEFGDLPDGIIKVIYPSANINLMGLLSTSNIDSINKKPVIVYLHGGWALGPSDVTDCEAFMKAGYIVFAPTYRGENGNDGIYELMLGEVDDAKEAIKWISKQPYVDGTKIYAFGHSAGGGISAMLSLQKDIPLKICGSSGGIYTSGFPGWDDMRPFDINNKMEGKMRVLIENIPSMLRPHYAYLGTEDVFEIENITNKSKNSKLTVTPVKGDHFTSLKPSMDIFLQAISKNQ
jgi:acetyl esterase/lipase